MITPSRFEESFKPAKIAVSMTHRQQPLSSLKKEARRRGSHQNTTRTQSKNNRERTQHNTNETTSGHSMEMKKRRS